MPSIHTEIQPFTKLYATNTTANADAVPAPTTTRPSGDGVVDLDSLAGNRASGNTGSNAVAIAFYGVGAGGAQASARITGWSQVRESGKPSIWIPTPLLLLDLTLGTSVGVAGSPILNTERFAQTIAAASGGEFTAALELVSPSANTVALLKLDTFGCERLSVKLWVATATSMNALIRPF